MIEHTIGYAYPSSPIANDLREPYGCWYVGVMGVYEAHTAFRDALQSAKNRGTTPSRWSHDHPLCVSMLSDRQREAIADIVGDPA